MTVVFDVLPAALAMGGAAYLKADKDSKVDQERIACQVYSQYYKRNLLDDSPDRSTRVSAALIASIDPQAAQCVKIIERYQEGRSFTNWMGMSTKEEPVGDTRTRVLEEMKKWCLTISEANIDISEIEMRINYCRRLLMYPNEFPASDAKSCFLSTVAQVVKQLEALLRRARSLNPSGGEQLSEVLRVTLDILCRTLLATIFTLPEEKVVPGRIKGQAADLPESALSWLDREDNKETDVSRLLRLLFASTHFKTLGASDEKVLKSDNVGSVGTSQDFTKCVEQLRGEWASSAVGPESGLLEAFRSPEMAEARGHFLDLCWNFDRAVFFLHALRPYQTLVGIAGDMAMCRQMLAAMIQELEQALTELRESRAGVMRAAKRRLMRLARNYAKASAEETRWMQGLRNIDETNLDELLLIVLNKCIEVKEATTEVRESELREAARKGIQDVVGGFESADFLARCKLRLPEGLKSDMRALSNAANNNMLALEAPPARTEVTNAPQGSAVTLGPAR